jgi:hypothetical protein
MLFESIFIVLILLVFSVVFYRGAIHEYTILQKNWKDDKDTKWSDLLSERAPLVIREVNKDWVRLWTKDRTSKFGWSVIVFDGKEQVRSTWAAWLKSNGNAAHRVVNQLELGEIAGLFEKAAEINLQFRRPYWIPGSFAIRNVRANLIVPRIRAVVGLQKTTAEATCWVATDGAPMRIWIAHEGATKGGEWLPANPYGRDPWALKPEETPWISELKFLEIRLRPGNMFILPPHWWVALRADVSDNTKPITEGSWYWTCEFHSPISWVATRFHNRT